MAPFQQLENSPSQLVGWVLYSTVGRLLKGELPFHIGNEDKCLSRNTIQLRACFCNPMAGVHVCAGHHRVLPHEHVYPGMVYGVPEVLPHGWRKHNWYCPAQL